MDPSKSSRKHKTILFSKPSPVRPDAMATTNQENIQIEVSVILCAFNPRPSHMKATLEGLYRQTLAREKWELIVVDNCSNVPLQTQYDLSWHPNSRFVLEKEIGLVRARVRGYRESQGSLVVHSDDDNIFDAEYLSEAINILNKHSFLGTFGGQLVPRFEVPPKNEREESFGYARTIDRPRWSNLIDDNRTMPFGAGMCLRREVINQYLEEIDKDPRRLVLGRAGNKLVTGEDIDLNFVAAKKGFATGLFPELIFEHFIPAEKMTEEHVIRYAAGNAYSMVILKWLHFAELPEKRSLLDSVAFKLRFWLRMDSFRRRLESAVENARRKAIRDLIDWLWIPS